MATVIEDLGSLPARIEASRDRLLALRAQVTAELETRDDLIIQAVDHACAKIAAVAKWAGVSQPHIIRTLAKSSD